MKRILALLLTVAMILSLAACGADSGNGTDTEADRSTSENTASAENVTGEKPSYEWSMAVVTAEKHPMTIACNTFADNLKELSDGRIKVNIYYGGQLGTDPETCAQVIDGTIEMALPCTGNLGSFSKLVYAYQLPFMITNWDQYKALAQSQEAQDLYDAIGDELGCKVLANWDAGFRHLLSVNKPMDSVSAMQGMKFRVGQNDLFISVFSALGANPTVIPYGEIYSSLQNKVIDGLEMDISAVWMEGHYEVAKYYTLTSHFTWPGLCVINNDVWNSLSDEDKAIVEAAVDKTLADNVAYIEEIEEETMQKLLENGVVVTDMTDSMYEEFTAAEKDVITQFASDPLVKTYYEKALELQ